MKNKRQPWSPADPAGFETQYRSGEFTTTELAVKHNSTYAQAMHYIERQQRDAAWPTSAERASVKTIESAKEAEERRALQAEEKLLRDFRKFLVQAKTRRQIDERFGEEAERLLTMDHEGLMMFNQLNAYSETTYVLLPLLLNTRVTIQDKDWKFHIPPDVNPGDVQPYELINLPLDCFKRFEDPDRQMGAIWIAPLFDVHYGHSAHKKEKFLEYIRWIKESPHIYAICGGDLMENALDDGRGMTYDAEKPPRRQADDIMDLLAPIAHKILVMIPGNHEERTYKKTGTDVMRHIASELKIPYFDGPVYMSIVAGKHKFKLYVMHGYGHSQTKGGKMNAAGRPRKWTDEVHFFLSGHVHDPVVNSETMICEDAANCRLVFKQQWTVVTQSFLRWANTYAYRAGFAPPGSGGVVIKLFEDGEYLASLK